MPRPLKIFLSIGATLFVVLFAFSILSYSVLMSKIPEYEGKYNVSGISENVRIYRDSLAIPYVFAESEFDAAFALGYIHAQERLFQMDFARRAGEGRLSEILGSKAIPFDKMFRTLGLYKLVSEFYEKLNPITKRYLESYSKGVNAYIEHAEGNFTFEFDILGYSPKPWKPEHSLVIVKLMAWELNISWWTDIAYTHLIQKLGVEKVSEIIPDYEENSPTIIPSNMNSYSNIPLDFYQTDKNFREFSGFTGTHIGSNNWVVNANKADSGNVIIANDPHLALQAPGKFLFSVIRSDNWNGEGFSIPGTPIFTIGKNKNISWALTNVMADDSDFYLEKLDSSKNHYFVDSKWKKLEITSDTIIVKDSTSVVYNILKTHRGPIISEIHPYNVLYKNEYQDSSEISIKWTALDFSDEIFALISVNKAKDWDEFKSALENFTAPGQNFVYGDKEGNIGYVCAVKLPKRDNNSPTLVFDGTSSESDWKGFVPYSRMPKLYNPKQNFIASANNKTVKDFQYHISNLWEPSSRIDRITELLKNKKTHSVDDFKNYQNDFYSHYAKNIIPFILSAFRDTTFDNSNLSIALTLFKKWDFIMNAQSQTPTIYAVFFQKLLENIFIDEMGAELFKEYIFVANVPYRKVSEILKNESSAWWDDVGTTQTESKNDIIRQSLIDAIDELENTYGNNAANWQWRNLHNVTFSHTFSSVSPLLGKVLDIGPYSIGGDGTTIFNTEYSFTKPYKNVLGPALKYIYDFSNPDEFHFIMPTGQSGYFLNDHYDDMTENWLRGNYITVNINTVDIASRSYSLLELVK